MRPTRPAACWRRGLVLLIAAGVALASVSAFASRSISPEAEQLPVSVPQPAIVPRAVIPALTRDLQAWSHGRAQSPASATFGESVEGRPLTVLRLGDGPLRVILVSGLHAGSEPEAVRLATDLFDHYGADPGRLAPELTLYLIPSLNADGQITHRRTNANGVDLNRNWPAENWSSEAVHGFEAVDGGSAPLSEPETRALHGFLQDHAPHLVISWHTYAGIVEGNDLGTAEALAATYAAAGDLELIATWEFYKITGDLLASTNEAGIPAFDVELIAGDADPFARHLGALEATLAGLIARHPVVTALIRDGLVGGPR